MNNFGRLQGFSLVLLLLIFFILFSFADEGFQLASSSLNLLLLLILLILFSFAIEGF